MNEYTVVNFLGDETIRRNSDNIWIPKDEGNTDYQAYLQWLYEGNEPDRETIS